MTENVDNIIKNQQFLNKILTYDNFLINIQHFRLNDDQ